MIVSNPIVVMKRFELKYLLTAPQEEFFLHGISGRLFPDEYGLTPIASLYYDTPEHRLISASLEKPLYKEKLRLRSYGLATDDSPVFLELKRKAYGIVYKRRVQSTVPLVNRFLAGEGEICAGGQINREITYFRDFYGNLAPSCLIICDRTAYAAPGSDLRITVDNGPRYRTDRLDLTTSMEGTPLLPKGYSILEIKVQEAMPTWLSRLLAEGGIYQTGFSKYGEAYKIQMTEQALARKAGA